MLTVYPDLLGDQAPPPLSPQKLEALPSISISQEKAGKGGAMSLTTVLSRYYDVGNCNLSGYHNARQISRHQGISLAVQRLLR
jgi:hypothetical protein